MALIMVTCWYPPAKAAEFGEKGVPVLPKLAQPEILKTLVIGVGSGEDGIEATLIYEVQKGKLEEALNLVYRFLHTFYGIEGFRYQVKVLRTVEEA